MLALVMALSGFAVAQEKKEETPGSDPAAAESSATESAETAKKEPVETKAGTRDPIEFFRQHFFPFEPFYFIAGTESPNAKFQISLRYQVFTDRGWLAEHWSGITNFSIAYTQTTLWDWNGPSAPFFDTSYKPEVNYTWLRVDQGRWADWFRLDLQGGAQHESNGKDGADSRSLNLAYIRPTVTFGREGKFQFSLSPKAYVYLGDLSENPDIEDYRGYVELRAILGWTDNVQLSATARAGDDFDHGSVQLDLTYPMWKLPILRSSLYLQAQYFTGYGESFLRYNERSDSFRAGFALFR
jgi:outer membrane phospholipase A